MKEKNILGIREVMLDNKNRIILPSFCGPQKSDRIVVLAKKDYIELWEYTLFCQFMDRLGKDSMDGYPDDITAFVYSVDMLVDSDSKVILTKDLVERYHLKDGILFEGKGNHIRLWNRQRFQCYSNQLMGIDCLKNDLDYDFFDKKIENRSGIYSVNGSSCISITRYLEDKSLNKVVLIFKSDFIEVWPDSKIINIKKEIEQKLTVITDKVELEKLKHKYYNLLKILSNGIRTVSFHDSSRSIHLTTDVVEKYQFEDKVVLEQQEDHFRIWNVHKYEFYQKRLEQDQLRKMLEQKVRARKLERKGKGNKNTD